MSEVASLEPCRELWELSGWDKTQNVWAIATGEENKDVLPWLRIGIGSSGAWEELSAYDLGYMLRKLPASVDINNDIYELTLTKTGHLYRIEYLHSDWDSTYIDSADTPENAACKLLCELFKQGILKKEGG